MSDAALTATRADTALKRLLPRIESRFVGQVDAGEWENYLTRLRVHFPILFDRLYALYGQLYDFFYHLESVLISITQMWTNRPDELKALFVTLARRPAWTWIEAMVPQGIPHAADFALAVFPVGLWVNHAGRIAEPLVSGTTERFEPLVFR